MKLTDALKKWAIDNKNVAKDADEKEFTRAITEALMDDSLTAEKFTALGRDPDAVFRQLLGAQTRCSTRAPHDDIGVVRIRLGKPAGQVPSLAGIKGIA